jgi:hypothetical protein
VKRTPTTKATRPGNGVDRAGLTIGPTALAAVGAAPAPDRATVPGRAAQLEASLIDAWDTALETFLAGIERGLAGVRELGATLDAFGARWQASLDGAASLGAVARIAMVLAGAALLAGLVRWGIAALLPRAAVAPARFCARLGDATRGAVADLAGLAAFALGAHLLIAVLVPVPEFIQ